MALQNSIAIRLSILGDGTSTTFKFDLSLDPYTFLSTPAENWFVGDRKLSNPSFVAAQNPNIGNASLLGTVVTVSFNNPIPVDTVQSLDINVFFLGRI